MKKDTSVRQRDKGFTIGKVRMGWIRATPRSQFSLRAERLKEEGKPWGEDEVANASERAPER